MIFEGQGDTIPGLPGGQTVERNAARISSQVSAFEGKLVNAERVDGGVNVDTTQRGIRKERQLASHKDKNVPRSLPGTYRP